MTADPSPSNLVQASTRSFVQKHKRLLVLVLIALAVMAAAQGFQQFLAGFFDALSEAN